MVVYPSTHTTNGKRVPKRNSLLGWQELKEEDRFNPSTKTGFVPSQEWPPITGDNDKGGHNGGLERFTHQDVSQSVIGYQNNAVKGPSDDALSGFGVSVDFAGTLADNPLYKEEVSSYHEEVVPDRLLVFYIPPEPTSVVYHPYLDNKFVPPVPQAELIVSLQKQNVKATPPISSALITESAPAQIKERVRLSGYPLPTSQQPYYVPKKAAPSKVTLRGYKLPLPANPVVRFSKPVSFARRLCTSIFKFLPKWYQLIRVDEWQSGA